MPAAHRCAALRVRLTTTIAGMPDQQLPHRLLGASGIEVSRLSLGSWRTFERMPKEQGVALMRHARELGIDFLDDARYDDETGTAPLRTGYSEVLFGELFRAAGWNRDAVCVANKLWWEFWPRQSAAEELDGSLQRMGLDHVDLIYSSTLPDEVSVETCVEGVAGLLASGKARAWGVVNWTAEALAAGSRAAAAAAIPQPCAVQLPYSLSKRDWVESPEMDAALDAAGAPIVASASLAGGALTGKYAAGGTQGRWAGQLGEPWLQEVLALGERLQSLAATLETTPAQLAIAFTLANPRVASTLVGATRTEQLDENASALGLLDRMTAEQLERLVSEPI
jgi:aryl-alcohol dehydrogenase-like predicted oxidoreductase